MTYWIAVSDGHGFSPSVVARSKQSAVHAAQLAVKELRHEDGSGFREEGVEYAIWEHDSSTRRSRVAAILRIGKGRGEPKITILID